MSGSPKAYDEWFRNIEKEYPLFQDKDGYTIGNIRSLKAGWKGALKWVLSNFDGETDMLDLGLIITNELKEE